MLEIVKKDLAIKEKKTNELEEQCSKLKVEKFDHVNKIELFEKGVTMKESHRDVTISGLESELSAKT